MALVYKNRGIVFRACKGGMGILHAAVFAPASSQSVGSHSSEADSLIPGIGAYGVILGASRDQVRQSPFVIGAKLLADQADGLMYRGDRGKLLAVLLTGGKVSQVEVMGAFRTPEGVTEKSTIPDIERAYGRADEYYRVENEQNPFLMFLILPVLLALGVAFGLLTGRVIRGKMQDDTGNQALVNAMMIAAIALATFSFLFGFVFLRSMSMSLDWKMLPVNMVSAGLTGAICVLVMKILRSRMSGCLGVLVTLFSMILVSSVVAVLTMGTGPIAFDAEGMMAGSLYAPFVIGMFLTGRPKTGH